VRRGKGKRDSMHSMAMLPREGRRRMMPRLNQGEKGKGKKEDSQSILRHHQKEEGLKPL